MHESGQQNEQHFPHCNSVILSPTFYLLVARKTLIDSDKRELMLLQEMYLPDGDLHSDGGGRFRRFRWKNVGESYSASLVESFAVAGLVQSKTFSLYPQH